MNTKILTVLLACALPAVSIWGQPDTVILHTPKAAVNWSNALRWNTVPDANLYRLQVATDSAFSPEAIIEETKLAADITTNANQTSLKPSALTGFTHYYWRVRAENGLGNGPWSTSGQFITEQTVGSPPGLMAPRDGSLGTGILIPQKVRVRFEWAETAGNPGFRFQLSTDSAFLNLIDDRHQDVSGVIHDSLNHDTRYFWRVQETGLGRYATEYAAEAASELWSETRSFVTLPIPSSPPVSPPALFTSELNGGHVPFMWAPTPGAESYQIQVASDSAFENIIQDTISFIGDRVSSLEWEHFRINEIPMSITYGGGPMATEEQTRYYWRVRALNGSGAGPYSGAQAYAPVGIHRVNPSPALRNISFEAGRMHVRISRQDHVRMAVLSPSGRKVLEVFDGLLDPGEHIFTLRNLPGGIYVLDFRIGNERRAVRFMP